LGRFAEAFEALATSCSPDAETSIAIQAAAHEALARNACAINEDAVEASDGW
jgi:hypothetical protein